MYTDVFFFRNICRDCSIYFALPFKVAPWFRSETTPELLRNSSNVLFRKSLDIALRISTEFSPRIPLGNFARISSETPSRMTSEIQIWIPLEIATGIYSETLP